MTRISRCSDAAQCHPASTALRSAARPTAQRHVALLQSPLDAVPRPAAPAPPAPPAPQYPADVIVTINNHYPHADELLSPL